MSLAKVEESAMLVELHISQWNPKKEDRRVYPCIVKEFNIGKAAKTAEEIGVFRKQKITKQALQQISDAVSAARSYHYKVTLPWKDGGTRMLPAATLFKYTKEIRFKKQKFENAVRSFIDGYPTHLAEAQRKLGGLFDPKEYPTDIQLKRYYRFSFSLNPIPKGGDFRLKQVDDRQLKEMAEKYEAEKDMAVANAMGDVWHRVYEKVSRMAEVLKNEKALLREAVIENVIEMAELLPELNIIQDPELIEIHKDIRNSLCSNSRNTLKDNPFTRKEQGLKAEQIADKMSIYMGGNVQ